MRILLGQRYEAVYKEVLVLPCHARDSTVPNWVVSSLINWLAFDWVIEEILRVYTSDFVFHNTLRWF